MKIITRYVYEYDHCYRYDYSGSISLWWWWWWWWWWWSHHCHHTWYYYLTIIILYMTVIMISLSSWLWWWSHCHDTRYDFADDLIAVSILDITLMMMISSLLSYLKWLWWWFYHISSDEIVTLIMFTEIISYLYRVIIFDMTMMIMILSL